jgi:hypothetical protein
VASDVLPRGMDRATLTLGAKWFASILQVLGYTATGLSFDPWNVYLFLVGLLGWLAVGFLWRDRAIILIHFIALGAMVAGLLS